MTETINADYVSAPPSTDNIGSPTNANLSAIIAQLRPINRLPKHAVDCIVKQATLYPVSVAESLQARTLEDTLVHFLIDGSVQIFEQDGSSQTINAIDPRAKNSLGRIAKNATDIVACCPSTLVRIPWETLERYLIQYAPAELSSTLEVQEILASTSSDWMVRLLQSDLFSLLPATNIQEILGSIEFVETFADEVIVEEGSNGEHFFIVDQGEFLVSRQNSKTGGEVELAVLKGDDFFGEEALITGAPRGATVTSLGKGKLIRLNSEKFKQFIVAPAIPLLSADGAKSLVVQGAHMIDIREPDKFAVGAIPDSANIMLNLLRAENAALDKHHTYIVIDDAPDTAATAAFVLRAKGYDARCLNLPLQKYAVLQGIELDQSTASIELSKSIKAQSDSPAGIQYTAPLCVDEMLVEDQSYFSANNLDDSTGDNLSPETSISSEEFANTLTGIGLAELIEELNETYDDDDAADIESVVPFQLEPTGAHDFCGSAEELENSNLDQPSGYEIEYHDDDDQSDTHHLPGAREAYSEETLTALAAQRKQLTDEFEQQLQARQQAAKQALGAHKLKLANDYREKQISLLNNGKKLVALANKVSQQKADIQRARVELGIKPTVTSLNDHKQKKDCPQTGDESQPAEGWSSFLRTAKY